MTESESIKLIQDLKIRQSELELKNQELRNARGKAETELKKSRAMYESLSDESYINSEAQFRTLFEAASIGIVQVDPSSEKFIWSNNKYLDITGYTKKELQEIKFSDITHPDDRERDLEVFIRAANGDTPGYSVEKRYIHKNGSIVWVRINLTFIRNSEGLPLRTLAICEDITEFMLTEKARRESESKYRIILNAVPDLIFITNPEGIYIDYHTSNTELLAIPPEQFMGKVIEDVLPGDIAKKFRNSFKLAKTNGNTQLIEYVLDLPGGSKYFEARINTISNDRFVSIVRDISESKQAEKDLVRLNNELKSAIATKDHMFSIIAHDLISPFNSILGFTDLLINRPGQFDNEASERIIRHINSSSKQTLNLLDNLLKWAKTQTGKIEFKPENLRLRPLIQAIVNFSESSARVKNISLNFKKSEDIVISGDKNMLETILRNLISNAIKFTEPGGKIDIYVTEDQHQAEFTVRDNGVGMSKEIIDSLFSIDSGCSSLGTSKEKGSGLGLVLCKEFIERHNGKIWVKSEPGKGSSFSFTLKKKPISR